MKKISIVITSYVLFIGPVFGFTDMLLNKNRQGYNKYYQQQYSEAYSKFSDPHWKGLAALKNKQFDLAIDLLADIQSIDGQYNLANAYALKGDFGNAISIYKDVLERDPKHRDAKHNLSVLEKLKQQSQNKEQDGDSKNNKDKNKQSKQKSKKNQQSKNDRKDKQDKDKQDKDKQDKDKQDKDKQDKDKQDKDKQDKDKQNKDKQNKNDQDKSASAKQQSSNDPEPKPAKYDEKQQADEQWLRTIPDDPGGLLRKKFLRDHLKRRGE